jgi:hypothetical protein
MIATSFLKNVGRAWAIFIGCAFIIYCIAPLSAFILSPLLPNWLAGVLLFGPRMLMCPDSLRFTTQDGSEECILLSEGSNFLIVLIFWLAIGLVFGCAARGRSLRSQVILALITILGCGVAMLIGYKFSGLRPRVFVF